MQGLPSYHFVEDTPSFSPLLKRNRTSSSGNKNRFYDIKQDTMWSKICFIITGTLFLILRPPLGAESLYLYQEGIKEKAIDQVLKENPLGAEQNIRSTLLHKSNDASIHLVQIRFKEKPHVHKTHDLLVILKRAEGVLHIGKEKISMKTGDAVFIPRGVVHFFENVSDEVAVGLGIFTPPFDGKDMIPISDQE